MKSFIIATFSQSRLLAHETDPEVRGGICVALCDYWLQSFLNKPNVEPQHRMQYLAAMFGQAKAHQKNYGQLRGQKGREDARKEVGRRVGVDYDAQTTVMRVAVGKAGILAKVAGDLRPPGSAATWTMRFRDGGGHAIAGVNRLERITGNFANTHAHVFDPNIGEYVGPFASLSAIIDDLFHTFADYGTTTEIHRTTAARV